MSTADALLDFSNPECKVGGRMHSMLMHSMLQVNRRLHVPDATKPLQADDSACAHTLSPPVMPLRSTCCLAASYLQVWVKCNEAGHWR